MGMELLTDTNTDRLHERASALLNRTDALRDELLTLNGRIHSLYPGWEGEASESLLRLWHDFFQAIREHSFVMTSAGHHMVRLANELALAQFEYRTQIAAAQAAGFDIRADGMIAQPPPAAPDADTAVLEQRADDLRAFTYRIQGALEAAEAADQRAANEFGEEQATENPALAKFLKTALGTEGYLSALAGTPGKTGEILGDLARNGGGTGSAAGAVPFNRVANNRILSMLTKTWKGLPATGWVAVPLTYAQSRAEGKDGGQAATDAGVSVALGVGTSAVGFGGLAAGVGTAAALGVAIPPVGVAIGVVVVAATSVAVAQQFSGPVSRFVHDRLVTPISEDIQELGDNVRDDFWDSMNDLKYHAKNFPRDFREAIMG